MAGTSYTRQSTLTDGDTITASLFNIEYDKLVSAFSYAATGTTGHQHDGGAGEGGNIEIIGDQNFLNKIVVDSTNNRWGVFVEVGGSAVEQIRIQDGAIVPVTDSDIDLGTSSLEFKDGFFDGTIHVDTLDVDANATIAGTLGVTGVLTATSLDISGDIDVDGTTNLDVVDIDGAVDMASTLAVAGVLTATSLDISGDVDVDGTLETDALSLNGTAVTSTAAELNILDGVTSTAAELNLLDGVTSTTAELNILDGVTSTTAELNILDGVTSTTAELNLLDGVTSTTAELNILDGVTSTAAELNILDGVTSTAAELNILDGVTASATDINLIDGITNGTVIASKAIITDANIDITGGRNITISGELSAATLDISGNVDVDGTLETDALTIGGVTLAETISDTVGAMVSSNTETNIAVTYQDADNTLDFALPASLEITTAVGVGGGSTNGVVISQGAISIKNGGAKSYIDLYCESSNAHYTRIEAAAHGAYSGNVTATLPTTTGTLALTSDIHTTEELQDIIGAMVSSNTESGITVAYQDADGTIDFTVGTLNQDTTGSAATLTTPRAIAVAGDVTGTANFDGSAAISITTALATDAIVTANITNANVTLAKMAANSVDSDQYVDGSIDTAHIANDQVTGDKLANDITIANNLVVSGNLAVTGTTTQTGSVVSDSNFTGLLDENTGNSSDFGLYGKYVESSTTKYAGLFYDASTDNTFRLFTDTQTVPGTTVNTGATGYAAANLIAAGITGTTATFSGDLNVDSGVLFADVSTNRVGINQASPDVSLDIGANTDAVHLPVGTTAQRPSSPAAGYFRYNSSLAAFEGYTDAWGSIGGGGSSTNTFTHDVFTCNGSTTAFALSQTTASENNLMVFVDGAFQEQGAYSIATASGTTTLTMSVAPANTRKLVVYTVAAAVSGSNLNIDSMTGDGSDTTLTLSIAPVNENNTQVFIDGVYQGKSTYSISGTTLTFSTAPPNTSAVEVMTMTQTDINVPVDGTITSAKLSGALTTPSTLAVTGVLTANGGAVFNEASADVDFRVESDGNTHALFVEGSSGNVGIGTSTPSSYFSTARNLVVGSGTGSNGMTIASASDGASRIFFADGTADNALYDAFIVADHNDGGSLNFGAGAHGTARMTIDSGGRAIIGGGITLGNGQTYAAANTLDDYEEGTWTLTIATGGGSSSSVSIGNTTGSYTKIGRQVTATIYTASMNISAAGSGVVYLGGLPFNCSSGSKSYAVPSFGHTNCFIHDPAGYVAIGDNRIVVTREGTITANDLSAGNPKYMMMTVTYFTDS